MNLAEATKMLKEHSVYPRYISLHELTALIKTINTKKFRDTPDLSCLTYGAFLVFIVQLAGFIYSRAPVDLSHLPLVEQVREMVGLFRSSAIARGQGDH